MIRFDCDYLEGAHTKILKRLVESNFEQTPGYSNDEYTKYASAAIKRVCKSEDIDIHILVGGTQTNLTVISSILKPYQAVICVDKGHINVHETGAIESCGHKILTVESEDGKITAEQIQKVTKIHNDSDMAIHMVMPKLVFIALPTECGTNYTKKELEDIYKVCKENDMYLYIDGARLGYGLVAQDTDLKIEDIPNLCDVFYIGGTKQGALFGEAVVIVNDVLKKDFRYHIKQKGAMLAKGRLLGIQFETLMNNDLYFTLSRHAVNLAMKIREALITKGYKLLYDSYTNQQFVIIPNNKLKELNKEFTFFKVKDIDENNTAIRICTSWATTEENVDKLIAKL